MTVLYATIQLWSVQTVYGYHESFETVFKVTQIRQPSYVERNVV